jgi:tetratricopeptide (TPR) repeat protein
MIRALPVQTVRTHAFVLVSLFFYAHIVVAQGANVLQGKVIAPNGSQPSTPVRVRVTFNGRPIHETFTDLSGRFSFPGLSKGTYQLTAEGDGLTFMTTSVYADVASFGSAPQSFTQDIQLRPMLREPTQRAGVVNAFSQVVPGTAKQALDVALGLAEKGKTEEAVKKMQEAIKIFPEYFDAHLQLGNIFLKLGRLGDAITELDLARQVNPNDERSYQSFGLVLMKQRNFTVAVSIFAEAARLNPSNSMNPLMRGTALIHQASTVDSTNSSDPTADRDFLIGRAEAALTQAANLSGNKVKADSLTLALFYEMKGEPGRAADELESYKNKLPQGKNNEALISEIKRLRDKSGKSSVKP